MNQNSVCAQVRLSSDVLSCDHHRAQDLAAEASILIFPDSVLLEMRMLLQHWTENSSIESHCIRLTHGNRTTGPEAV